MSIVIRTPDWVKHAIFYQIFPDRFKRGSEVAPPPGVTFKPWGTRPEAQGFQGGDLYGVIESLPYLLDLGITALYLNPIFSSAANHRYHTFDYYQVDPLLGGNDALRALLDAAHEKDMKVVLDGVFNHASRGFWPFHHVLENGSDSPYIDWFTVHDWPLNPYPENKDEPINYDAWWGLPALPKLNTKNIDVQQYILDIATYWINFGIDGWRLDVPAEIDDDHFWQQFRRVVKRANPDAYICGEIWEEAQRWLQGDQFDAVMNYTVSWAAMSYCGHQSLRPGYDREHLSLHPLDASAVAEVIDDMHGWYDWEINQAQLNLLGSHDTARALWVLSEDKTALKMCVLLQMTLPGAPCIYYGDEIGMSAGDDPYCREAFPWDNKKLWDEDLLRYFSDVCALRHGHEVLRIGDFESIYTDGMVWAFRRRLGEQVAYIVFNAGDDKENLAFSLFALNAEFEAHWVLNEGMIDFAEGQPVSITMQPKSGLVLTGLIP
ncbi:MAG: glycoside hydrolase family 13 protein [Rhodothermales bacterium]